MGRLIYSVPKPTALQQSWTTNARQCGLSFMARSNGTSNSTSTHGLQICAVLRDWQRSKAKIETNYPLAPIVIVDVPLWSQQERDHYVRERVKIHQDAEYERLTGGHIPHCSDEERWKREDTFAVKKRGNKRALRVFDSMAEAEAFAGEASEREIEERKGRCVRCDDNWCRVAQWCEQYENEAWA